MKLLYSGYQLARMILAMPLSMLVILMLLVACGPTDSAAETEADANVTAEALRTDTPISVAVQQDTPLPPSPTPIPTAVAPTTMVIWWPEPLAPLDNAEANELLSEHISAFKAAQGNIEVQLRRKLEMGIGGIMSTLRTASPVAPGALPDLTLMRREDLLIAAQSGLIYPLEGYVSSAVLNDLYPAALSLGRVDGQLYGLPYMLDVQHMAYSDPGAEQVPSQFAQMLNQQVTFALPAAQASQANNVLLTQYLDAGGELPDSESLGLDVESLARVLRFYEDAVNQDLINSSVLSYTSPYDYQNRLFNNTLDAGVVTSSVFLNWRQLGQTLGFGPVPTESGAIIGELDGWMWVMTTSSADRQALAGRFLNWMLDASEQGSYSRAVNMIPSQRTALQTWPDDPYITFVRQVLSNALLPLTSAEDESVVRAMQSALIAVISSETTAEEAAQDLVDTLAD